MCTNNKWIVLVNRFDWIFIFQGGFTYNVKYTKNCDSPERIIKMLNSSLELNNKCEAFSRSCSEIKAYRKAVVKLSSISKSRIWIFFIFHFFILQVQTIVYKSKFVIFQKTTDLCDSKSKKSEMLRIGLGLFGVPFSCGFNSTIFCYNGQKVVRLSESSLRLLHVLTANGNSAVWRMVVTHDNGKSCFETENEIFREWLIWFS